MAEELDNSIQQNAAGPRKASGDSGSVEQHALPDQIAADKYLESKKASRAKGLGIQDFQQRYLKLPTDMRRPPYREGPSRAYWWQFLLMSCVDSAFVLILARNFLGWSAAVPFATIWLGIHAASYYGLSRTREQNEIPGGDA